jgi:hypothetical protein
MIRVVHPGSGSRIRTFYPSLIPGSKRHRIHYTGFSIGITFTDTDRWIFTSFDKKDPIWNTDKDPDQTVA